jgi:myo-inositol-1(or 4)-monophosphatase
VPEPADRGDDLALLLRATGSAAALAFDFFTRGDVEQWDKSPGNPVSAADLAVDAQLKAELKAARPGDGWLSEETADDSARLAARRVWVVDPIDGTRDFIRGRTGWAVSVALVEDGAVTMAALAAPARGQLFVGVRGEGATVNGTALRVSGRSDIAGIRLPVDPPALTAAFWPEPWDAVAVEKPNSLALRIAHVARDAADGFIEGRTIAEWDIAAAALILTEAGGTVTDRHGAPVTFNRPSPAVHGLVAATPALHGALRTRLDGGLRALAAARTKRPA